MDKNERLLYEFKAGVLKALAHPSRLWMVEHLEAGECCVCELVEGTGFDFSTISKHLRILKEAGIVDDEKRGKWVYYRLKVPCILNFMNCIEAVLKQNADEKTSLLNGTVRIA